VFGQSRYSSVNQLLNRRFHERGRLIAVHRGLGHGPFVENTTPAVVAAVRSGADMVEVDVVRSADGRYFVFHDGKEPNHFGFDRNIQTLTSGEIEELSYRERTVEPRVRVESLESMLLSVPDHTILNIDRSWRYWPHLLEYLASFNMTHRLLMKLDARNESALDAARAHESKYPLLPIVSTQDQIDRVLDDSRLNVVGVELLADSPESQFCDPGWLKRLRERGIFAYVNAIDLGNGRTLFAGWDDTVSVLESPDRGWGQLVDRDIDVIQTDWPNLLDNYLQQRGVRSGAPSVKAAP
jgi:hypothetical protein